MSGLIYQMEEYEFMETTSEDELELPNNRNPNKYTLWCLYIINTTLYQTNQLRPGQKI